MAKSRDWERQEWIGGVAAVTALPLAARPLPIGLQERLVPTRGTVRAALDSGRIHAQTLRRPKIDR
ncbi:MAG: hypothetical protein IT169_08380 [Bryobacterales bacterium]|nr:hypothetical protein [Bryobacterales bacterium]